MFLLLFKHAALQKSLFLTRSLCWGCLAVDDCTHPGYCTFLQSWILHVLFISYIKYMLMYWHCAEVLLPNLIQSWVQAAYHLSTAWIQCIAQPTAHKIRLCSMKAAYCRDMTLICSWYCNRRFLQCLLLRRTFLSSLAIWTLSKFLHYISSCTYMSCFFVHFNFFPSVMSLGLFTACSNVVS